MQHVLLCVLGRFRRRIFALKVYVVGFATAAVAAAAFIIMIFFFSSASAADATDVVANVLLMRI